MRAPRPPPSRTEGVGGAGPQGARRVTLKPREPGVSTFAQRRVQPGSTIDEAGILGVLWEAIHHGRTLYGRPCKDLRSFFDACDPEGHEAIVNDRLSDAMLRLGVGLTPQQVDTLISTIDVDVTGTVDYDELENWMRSRDEKVAAKYRAGIGAGDLASRAPWGSKAANTARGAKNGNSGKGSARTPRLPDVSSARRSNSPLDEDRHEYLQRDVSAMVLVQNPILHVEPKASQLEAAIMMHERGYQERRLVYSEERAAARAAEEKKALVQRRKMHEENQHRLIEHERHRKNLIAKQFGLKMTEIDPEEWAEVEAELEAQVQRREKRKKRKEDVRNDPAGMKRKRQRAIAKRTYAAIKIQAWMRGHYTRRVVIAELQSEKAERERKEALRQRKRLEVCDTVVQKLVTDLERAESMEQVALMNQLRTLQNQKVQLEEQYHAALDPTETASAKAKAKRLAEEGKFAQRWARLQKKREEEERAKEEARAREIALAKTKLPTIFGTAGNADASPPIPPTAAATWGELRRGQQAAATRLGFNAQCWPELEENAITAVHRLNKDLAAWDEWHAGTWTYIDKTLRLGSVASILGLTEMNWNKLKRCKTLPKRVYRIGTPPKAPVVEREEPVQESEAIRLHKLAVFLSSKHTASLQADLTGHTPASMEHFYDRLCTSLRPFIRVGMPESLASMLKDGLMQLGWAGGETSDGPRAKPEPEPEPEDENTAREKALAKQLEEMKALAKAMRQSEPEPEPEPEPGPGDDSGSEVHLIQLRAEETLNQLHAISGSKESQAIPTHSFGLRAGRHMSEFLRKCVQTVHELRSEYHSLSNVATATVTGKDKQTASSVVASIIHAALGQMDAKKTDETGGTLTRISHRLIDAFRFFDRNGDGKISPRELQLALRSLNKGGDKDIGADLSLKEIEKFVKQGDTDGDGSIDYKEFVAHFHYYEAEVARAAQEQEDNERRKAQASAQHAADKLAAAQKQRLDKAAREEQARIVAAEAESALKYEARRVLPAVFNAAFEKLGLAQEQAARRLGFTPEQWPRLSSASPAVRPWENLDQPLKRMAEVLGFDEEQDPPTWVLVQVEGEKGEGDVRSLGVVTGVRHAQQEILQDEERKRREREVIAFRKSVFAQAATLAAEKHAANRDAQEKQQQHTVLGELMQEENAAACIQRVWKNKKAEKDDSEAFDEDALILSEEDERRVEAIWVWSLDGDRPDFLSRQRLERYLIETTGRELTDSLYKTMCEKIGFDSAVGMEKSTFVVAFYGPYMDPGQSASAQIAAHYDKLDLANASRPIGGAMVEIDTTEPTKLCSISREQEAELRQIFACVDVNGDGALSRAELILRLRKDPDLAAMLDLPVKVGEEQRAVFEAVFQSMDRDNDNEIDADEFVEFFARRKCGGQAVPNASNPIDLSSAVAQSSAGSSQPQCTTDTSDEATVERFAAPERPNAVSSDMGAQQQLLQNNASPEVSQALKDPNAVSSDMGAQQQLLQNASPEVSQALKGPNAVSGDTVEQQKLLQNASPAVNQLSVVNNFDNTDSDSEEELSIEELRLQRQAQLRGTPPRRGPQ